MNKNKKINDSDSDSSDSFAIAKMDSTASNQNDQMTFDDDQK